MIKRSLMRSGAILAFCCIAALTSSCFTQSFLVGGGAKGTQEETAQNWFLVYGLANISNTNISAMARGASGYTISLAVLPDLKQSSFVDKIISIFYHLFLHYL